MSRKWPLANRINLKGLYIFKSMRAKQLFKLCLRLNDFSDCLDYFRYENIFLQLELIAFETQVFLYKTNKFFNLKGNVIDMMFRRITSQVNQARTFFQSVLGFNPPQSNQRADLVRDKFGLHKMIVAVTSSGKVLI